MPKTSLKLRMEAALYCFRAKRSISLIVDGEAKLVDLSYYDEIPTAGTMFGIARILKRKMKEKDTIAIENKAKDTEHRLLNQFKENWAGKLR